MSDLETCVARLSERIDVLETSVRGDLVPRSVSEDSPRAEALSAPAPPPVAAGTPGWMSLAGRTFLVLAGAFLLRALTDSGRLPTTPGVWVGLGYAALWLVLGGRTGGRSGMVHGFSALIVALPLVLEAATRFHVLGPAGASLVLCALTLGALGVSSSHRQALLALAALVGAFATALAISIMLDSFLAPTFVTVVLALVAYWIADEGGWPVVAWPAAAGANLALLLLTVRASVSPPRDAPIGALATQGAFLLGYLGLFLWRTRRSRREVRAFEIAQTIAALAVALGGGAIICRADGLHPGLVGLPAMVFGIMLYSFDFAWVLPGRGAGRQFNYVGMTALGLALTGLTLFLAPAARPIVLSVLTVALSLVASRAGQPLLALHSSITGIVAAAAGGLISFTTTIWLTHPDRWPVPDRIFVIVLAAVLAALLIPRALRHAQPSPTAIAARLALATTLVAGLCSVVVIFVGPLVAGRPPNIGMLVTAKSVILSLGTLGVAYASRAPRFGELAWLTYGLLGIGALKILFEDFPSSQPSTLFVALAAYGAVLIVAPKIVKPS